MAGILDRVRGLFRSAPAGGIGPQPEAAFADLPLRRAPVDAAAAVVAEQKREALLGGLGPMLGPDPELEGFRRLTSNDPASRRRDLAPLKQDQMLEVCWWLYEANPFGRRIITLMTDLVVGDGITIEAEDDRIQEIIDESWGRTNQMGERVRRIHDALSLNGELILPVAVNEVTGKLRIGFIDPYVVKEILPVPGDVTQPDLVTFKSSALRSADFPPLKVIRENPVTGLLEGDVFYFSINALPNSTRGRSDLLALADWLDVYDQYMFAEAERAALLSNFMWDLSVDGDDVAIKKAKRDFPAPKPGSVYAHNSKVTLEARTPDLKASDRSELARMFRVHIAGSFGYPEAWLGDADAANRSALEGQNDVMLKTPSARQKLFDGAVRLIVRFMIEQALGKNPALYKDAVNGFRTRLPELASKDLVRAGSVLASVASAMDVGMANGTVSKRLATTATLAVLKPLGVDEDLATVQQEIEEDGIAEQAMRDEMQAAVAARRAQMGPAGPAGDPAAANRPPAA